MTVFLSSKDIFTELTIHEIDGILKILQKSSCKECPLVVPKKLKKINKEQHTCFRTWSHQKTFSSKEEKNQNGYIEKSVQVQSQVISP